jgi:superfamily I DNA and/or RNA helicase
VDVCLREAERHRREAPDASVVVLCPYLAQCRAALARGTGVPVHSVDSFQGREADVVVLSIVRRGDACGFWEDARRLVVATTRARTHMVVVGGFDWTCGPLAELRADAERRGVLEEA